jgi:DNA polymerase (family X)
VGSRKRRHSPTRRGRLQPESKAEPSPPILAHNEEIAQAFDEVADLLELKNDNPFRIRAYRNAARVLRGLTTEVGEMLRRGDKLEEIPGIGEDLAEQIAQMAHTGRLTRLEELSAAAPRLALQLTRLPNIGPKRAMRLCTELGARTLDEVKRAAKAGKIRALTGFGAKFEQGLMNSLAKVDLGKEKRFKLAAVQHYADAMLAYLRRAPGFETAEVAGSFRRRKETVGDLDFIVAAQHGPPVIDWFQRFPEIETTVSAGTTRATATLRSGLQVDVRVVPQESYGAALVYFTGSKAHNIALRRRAQERRLKINEYGVFRGERAIAGATEASVYAAVGLPEIEPELREDQGEIEAAASGASPDLLRLSDIRGDLHAHTSETDGANTLEELAKAAKKLGLAYIAITDHSRRLAFAHGLDETRLLAQIERIDAFNEGRKGIEVLKGVEVDILENDDLDLPDATLARLDLVIGAIHSGFGLSRDKQTARILRAMDHPHFSILAHPTGRLLLERDGYEIDMQRVIRAAKARGCLLELNAQPDRLDLSDVHCRMAKSEGVMVSINTDAHRVEDFNNLQFGVWQARRGWLEKGDVLNTRSLSELRPLLKATMSRIGD